MSNIVLKSARGVNYSKLQQLLAAKNWRNADIETDEVMLIAAGRKGWLDESSIDNFPCEDLRTINQLWLHYSQGQFGFSIQKQIYESLGGTREYNIQVWEKFCDHVGWINGENWYNQLIFDVELAPPGHLPCCVVRGVDLYDVFGERILWRKDL